MVIRQAQMDVFSKAGERAFLDRMCLHVTEHFPRQAAAGDSNALRKAVHDAIKTGRERGLSGSKDLCRYLNLHFLLGLDDPGQVTPEWVEAVWRDRWVSNAEARLDRILALYQHRMQVEAKNQVLRRQFEGEAG